MTVWRENQATHHFSARRARARHLQASDRHRRCAEMSTAATTALGPGDDRRGAAVSGVLVRCRGSELQLKSMRWPSGSTKMLASNLVNIRARKMTCCRCLGHRRSGVRRGLAFDHRANRPVGTTIATV
jgi:hypothetical protein